MSKNIIFYFTGTGNSLKAARDIAGKIGDCDVILMPAYKEKIVPAGYERVGFVFPVYAGGPPLCVRKFIEETDFSLNSGAYFFTVATYGVMQANTFYIVNNLLKAKGISLSAVFGVNMWPNYIVSYDMPKFISFMSKNYSQKISAIAERILNKKRTAKPKKEIKFLANTGEKFQSDYNEMDRDYNISADCVGCGICAKVCPVRNIIMKNGKPTFEHRCEQCVACIHACPKHALNYKDKTQTRARYHNPDVTLKDLYVPQE